MSWTDAIGTAFAVLLWLVAIVAVAGAVFIVAAVVAGVVLWAREQRALRREAKESMLVFKGEERL